MDRRIAKVLGLALATHWPLVAGAVPVTIDPGAFTGTYVIQGTSFGANTGLKTFELAPGTYGLDIGSSGSCSRKSIVVNPDGSVSNSATNDSSGALTFSGSTVGFRNATITVGAGAFTGTLTLLLSTTTPGTQAAPFSRVVVPDNVYRVRPQSSFTTTHFRVNAAGGVEDPGAVPAGCQPGALIAPAADSLTFSGSTVTLRNTTVRFDPRAYVGRYLPFSTGLQGVQDVVVIPGFSHQVQLTTLANLGYFFYTTNADGSLAHFTPVAPLSSGVNQVDLDNSVSPPAVRFRNTTVHFNPGAYAGSYRLELSSAVSLSEQFGPTSHVLLPDTRYEVRIGTSRIHYGVTAAGAFEGVPTSPNNAADSMDFDGDTAYFRTSRISISPTVPADAGKWRVIDVIPAAGIAGSATLDLVQEATYQLSDLDVLPTTARNVAFDVLAPCGASPGTITYAGNSAYRLTCAPQANAGNDRTVEEGALVALDGSASSIPAGGGQLYAWSQVGGPAVTLAGDATATPSFTAPQVSGGSTVLTFRLEVSDGFAFSAADTVDVLVTDVNRPPVADAGNDFELREGATGQLDGSNSYDPDGDGLSYLWTQLGGPPVTLSSGMVQRPTFQAPLGGAATLVFRLQVSDGSGLPAAEDLVQVAIGPNTPPVANAGPDQVVNEGTTVTLAGSGSDNDQDDAFTYEWTQLSGPAVTLSNAGSAAPQFTAPQVGAGGSTVVFALVTRDDYASNPKASAPDTVSVTIQNVFDPPRCDLARASVDALWPPDHKMREVAIENVADPNGTGLVLAVTSVTQDEPRDGLGDGDTAPDAAAAAAGRVLLRAERSGTGNGRVYRINFTATSSGQACTGAVTVAVPRVRQGTAIDDGQAYSSFP